MRPEQEARIRKSNADKPNYVMDREDVDIQMLLAEIDRLRAAMTWQPIETCEPDTEVLLGWWETFPKTVWRQKVGVAYDTRGGWMDGAAKFWMPAPGAPEAGS